MDRVWNVGVVGLNIGRSHIVEGYARHPDRFKVAAVCDLDPGRLARVGDEASASLRLRSFEELLARPEIDIVDICTPPGLHVPQAIAALRAGKQVVCEKPLSAGLADIARLAEVERETGRRVLPIYQCRWGDGIAKARHLIRAGIAGRPFTAIVETAWNRDAAYYAVPWRGKWDTELGGVLVSQAIHIHDMLMDLMGPVASAFCRVATRVNAIEVEDCVTASLVMRSGALASISATLGSQEDISRIRLCFEHLTIESGRDPYRPGTGPWQFTPASPAIAARIDEAFAGWQPVGSGFDGLMLSYAAALDGDAPWPVTLADAHRSLELITAFYHSVATGAEVSLPLAPDHPRWQGWRLAAST